MYVTFLFTIYTICKLKPGFLQKRKHCCMRKRQFQAYRYQINFSVLRGLPAYWMWCTGAKRRRKSSLSSLLSCTMSSHISETTGKETLCRVRHHPLSLIETKGKETLCHVSVLYFKTIWLVNTWLSQSDSMSSLISETTNCYPHYRLCNAPLSLSCSTWNSK